MPSLLDLCAAKFATLIKDKTEEEIFLTFQVVDDFTKEERIKAKEDLKCWRRVITNNTTFYS
jgi:hypothetical protein